MTRWKQRRGVVGMAQRPDLVLAAAATDPDDKTRLDEIVEAAMEHAGSSAAATTGTSLHALTERLDRGQKLGRIPEPYGADLKAYEKATAGIEWTAIETFRVLDGWKVAGTADRIGLLDGHLVIADIKTGSIDYPSKFALQLACYARSLPYDIITDSRGPAQTDLDLEHGLIVHLPAGTGRCQLYRVDIAKGWEACLLAKRVWDWRSVTGLLELTDDTTGVTPTLIDLAAAADSVEELRNLWRKAKAENALTDEFLAICEARHKQLQEESSQ
ncbi:MAG TPA: PD-(D/E)XK nuclease family protein [Mycobacterium sp.]|nr:PD-(D/E)XK nuclease family protein [Mycobacterium sp.]HTX96842.1 PD-(D/E)XK nuclease family protein [Mycobacterium sp.]